MSKRVHVANECPNRRTTFSLSDGCNTEDDDEGEEKNEGQGDRGYREEGAWGIKKKGWMRELILLAS